MKRLFYHIIYRTLGILLVVLTMAPAMAQVTVPNILVDQCDTIEFSVVDMFRGDRYTWDLYRDSTVNFATENGDLDPGAYFEDGMYEGSTVRVIAIQPGRYFVRVMAWDEVTCTNNLKMFSFEVLDTKPTAELEGDSVCYGEPAVLKIILTGNGPWDVTYTYGDGTAVINVNGITSPKYSIPIAPLPIKTTEYWITSVIDQCSANLTPSNTARVVVYLKPKSSKIYQFDK